MQTKRLMIRKFRTSDADDLYEYLAGPQVVEFEPYLPFSYQAAQETAAQRSLDENFWAVCLKANQKMIGNLYLAETEAQIFTLGYVFNRTYQKQGLATEAVKKILDWAFYEKSAHRVVAHCNPKNERSWQLLERCHFYREGLLRKNVAFFKDAAGLPLWQDTFVYGLLEEEYRKLSKQ
ncbi:GNAT family N-acetyltransferase [Enterococcus sp. LJL90]